MMREAVSVRSATPLKLVSWTDDGIRFRLSGTEQQIGLDASLQLTKVTSSATVDEKTTRKVTRAERAQLKHALKPRTLESALHLGEHHVLVRTTDGALLEVGWPIGSEPQVVVAAVDSAEFQVVACGAHWFAWCAHDAYVGRAGRAPQVLRVGQFIDRITARERGIVFTTDRILTFVPWHAFEIGDELLVTPIELALPADKGRRAKVLLAGATMFRIEILDPPAHWKRATMTGPAHGNPLGLAVGDIVIAEGHDRATGFEVTRVRAMTEPPSTSATVRRSPPTHLAKLGAVRPRWLDALLAAALIDDEAMVPRHTWFDGAADALAAIYAPRDAMQRGWFRCKWKFWRDTDDPAADLIALAAPANLEVASIDPTPDADELRIRSKLAGKRPRTKTVELNTISDLVPYLNELLADAGCARRIYECRTGGNRDWYAFLARTPDEISSLIAAGFTELSGIQQS